MLLYLLLPLQRKWHFMLLAMSHSCRSTWPNKKLLLLFKHNTWEQLSTLREDFPICYWLPQNLWSFTQDVQYSLILHVGQQTNLLPCSWHRLLNHCGFESTDKKMRSCCFTDSIPCRPSTWKHCWLHLDICNHGKGLLLIL